MDLRRVLEMSSDIAKPPGLGQGKRNSFDAGPASSLCMSISQGKNVAKREADEIGESEGTGSLVDCWRCD